MGVMETDAEEDVDFLATLSSPSLIFLFLDRVSGPPSPTHPSLATVSMAPRYSNGRGGDSGSAAAAAAAAVAVGCCGNSGVIETGGGGEQLEGLGGGEDGGGGGVHGRRR